MKAGLEDGAMAVEKGLELFGVLFDASDGVPKAGQAGARDETDIPTTDNCYVHGNYLFLLVALDKT
jgi:hypothetical protein